MRETIRQIITEDHARIKAEIERRNAEARARINADHNKLIREMSAQDLINSIPYTIKKGARA